MSGHRWSLSPLLPSLTGHPCRRWQVLTRLKRSVGTSVCSRLISAGRLDLKLLTFFFLFTPNLFLPQSSHLSTRTPTFWLLLSDSLVPSATLPVLSQASPAHVPTGWQLLTDPPWPPLVDATATCDVDRSGRLLWSPYVHPWTVLDTVAPLILCAFPPKHPRSLLAPHTGQSRPSQAARALDLLPAPCTARPRPGFRPLCSGHVTAHRASASDAGTCRPRRLQVPSPGAFVAARPGPFWSVLKYHLSQRRPVMPRPSSGSPLPPRHTAEPP